FKSPKPLPAGTRLVFDMTWDNSAQNPANPDPNRAVHWGDQTWDEMNAGWVRYRYADEAVETAASLRSTAGCIGAATPARLCTIARHRRLHLFSCGALSASTRLDHALCHARWSHATPRKLRYLHGGRGSSSRCARGPHASCNTPVRSAAAAR